MRFGRAGVAGKIFVNYRRDDERAMAARVRDRLAAAFGEANVFMDVDNLLPGQRFDQELDRALAQTDVLLAVIGPRWLALLQERQAAGERDFVRDEIATALKRGVVVVPVLIEHAPLPRADELPEDMRSLVLHQKHVVNHEDFGRDVAALVAGLRASRKQRRSAASPGRQRARWPVFALTASALAVVALVVYFAMRPPTRSPAGQEAREDQTTPPAVDVEPPSPGFDDLVTRLQLQEVAQHRQRVRLCEGCAWSMLRCSSVIETAEAVRGRRVRAFDGLEDELTDAGAQVVSVATAELYTALQVGVIDCIAGR